MAAIWRRRGQKSSECAGLSTGNMIPDGLALLRPGGFGRRLGAHASDAIGLLDALDAQSARSRSPRRAAPVRGSKSRAISISTRPARAGASARAGSVTSAAARVRMRISAPSAAIMRVSRERHRPAERRRPRQSHHARVPGASPPFLRDQRVHQRREHRELAVGGKRAQRRGDPLGERAEIDRARMLPAREHLRHDAAAEGVPQFLAIVDRHHLARAVEAERHRPARSARSAPPRTSRPPRLEDRPRRPAPPPRRDSRCRRG